jgi:UDP-3-O-[3-hydroxymyristoyl] N-acetylglucosamine deacetylase
VSPGVPIVGIGLHTGAPARVILSARSGPVALRSGGLEATLGQLSVSSSHRSTTVQAYGGRISVGMVEHAFAALGGLGLHRDVVIEVDGPEMPLLDGGARVWCEALSSLGVTPCAPRLRIARAATLEVGSSRYELAPGPAVDVQVVIELDNRRIEPFARWMGDPGDFMRRIAPSRTFAQTRDLEELAQSGLSRHVEPESVVLVAPDRVHVSGRAFAPDEPARHKLLDLVGDCYLWGGPPLGSLRAIRPGHRANALAFAQALEQGFLSLD